MESSNLHKPILNHHISFLCNNSATTDDHISNPNYLNNPSPKPNLDPSANSAYDYPVLNPNYFSSLTAFSEMESCSSFTTAISKKRQLLTHDDIIAEKRIRVTELDDGGGGGEAGDVDFEAKYSDLAKKKRLLQFTMMEANSFDYNSHFSSCNNDDVNNGKVSCGFSTTTNNSNVMNNTNTNTTTTTTTTTTTNNRKKLGSTSTYNANVNMKNDLNAKVSDNTPSTPNRSNNNDQILHCQVKGCPVDLSKAPKDYHRRHKVCEMHSKAAFVIISGLSQRFCQQCSRFHALSEFDDTKRSCRRRLEGHNKRRRKPNPQFGFIHSGNLLLHPILGMHNNHHLHLNQLMMQHHHHHQLMQLMCPSRVTWEYDQAQCQQPPQQSSMHTTSKEAIRNCLGNAITSNERGNIKTYNMDNEQSGIEDEGVSSSSSSSPSFDNKLFKNPTSFPTYDHNDIQGGTKMNINDWKKDHHDHCDGILVDRNQHICNGMPSCALSLLSRPAPNKTFQLNMSSSNHHQEQLALMSAQESVKDNVVSKHQMVKISTNGLDEPNYFNNQQRSSCSIIDQCIRMAPHNEDANQATKLVTQKWALCQNQISRAPTTFDYNDGGNIQSNYCCHSRPSHVATIDGLTTGATEQFQNQGNRFYKDNLFYFQNLYAHLSSSSST